MTQQLWRLSATEIAQREQQREVSAREVADAALARLEAVNPAINAVVEHRPDDVRRKGRRSRSRDRPRRRSGPARRCARDGEDQRRYRTHCRSTDLSYGLFVRRSYLIAIIERASRCVPQPSTWSVATGRALPGVSTARLLLAEPLSAACARLRALS